MKENLDQNLLDFTNSDIDKSLPTISITDCLDYLEWAFDKEGVAQNTYNKNFNNPESKYYQMSVEQIIESWEEKGAESCRYGSMLDNYIGNIFETPNQLELWKLDNSYEWDERLQNLCKSFDAFYDVMMKSGDIVFIAREKTVYYEYNGWLIKGRFDFLCYNKRTNKYIIIDWKSSGSIDKTPTRWTKKMKGPMFKYPQLNYYRYTLQLHYYKRALIKKYLPAGTTEDNVEVLIVSLPGHIIEENGQMFNVYKEAIKYDPMLIDNMFKFAIQKRKIEQSNL